MNEHGNGESGFTLVELTVVIAIMVALAAVVLPMVGQVKRDSKVAEILQTVDTLRSACNRYYSDTGATPIEYSSYTSLTSHQLSVEQTNVVGWNGPYISQPLTKGESPVGADIYVYRSFDSAFQRGFRLISATGDLNATGTGSFVRYNSIPEDIAELVNDALDSGITGDWKIGGRVTYTGTTLYIFLMDIDGK